MEHCFLDSARTGTGGCQKKKPKKDRYKIFSAKEMIQV
jgi:hypothetical protein